MFLGKNKIKLILFSIGALGYGLIEILWRGYTHWSMLGAGGICFMIFGEFADKIKKFNLLFRAIIGGLIITFVELFFGIVFNVILKKNVWDYSKMPFNIAGQICALYSCFWAFLSIIFIPFASLIKNNLQKSK